MWTTLVLIISVFVASTVTYPKTKGVYKSCADKHIESTSHYKYHILCKASTFQVERPGDSTYPGMKEMMDCTFTEVGWMDAKSKELIVTKIADDLKEGGYPDKLEKIKEQNELCKNIYDAPRNAMNYLDCIGLRPNATKEIITFIRNREPEFFKEFHCRGITF